MFDEQLDKQPEMIAGFKVDPPDPKIREELETVEGGLYQSAKNNWTSLKVFLELASARPDDPEIIESLHSHRPKKYDDYIKDLPGTEDEEINDLDPVKVAEHDEFVDQFNATLDAENPDLESLLKIINSALSLFGEKGSG
jgi:hypothetical protein